MTVPGGSREPAGLGGWIIAFQAFIVAVIGLFLAGLIMSGVTLVLAFAVFIIVAVTVVGLYLIAKRDSRTPRYWVIYLSVATAAWVLIAMLTGTVSFATFVYAALFIAWIVYWNNSKRVKNTFLL
jgi:hypothetical protein